MAVSWLPWSPAAFKRAKEEDKLVLLSVSARWCHWCRVMDEETYGNPAVIELIDRDYIPVRIDADERPDLSERYNMGGWPSTLFLTGDAEIVWGATYMPVDQLQPLLAQFRKGFQEHRERILQEIREREEKIRRIQDGTVEGEVELNGEIFRRTVTGIVVTVDPVHGGFGRAPKFPMPVSIDLLFRAHFATEGADFQELLTAILRSLGEPGLYDEAAGGFYRYATTEAWGAPHYEKLLEDNALITRCYLRSWQVFANKTHRKIAERTLDWAMRTLWDKKAGLFRGSQAADNDFYRRPAPERRNGKRPPVDPSAYTDSNAVMISTLILAWAILGSEKHLKTARTCLDALREKSRTGNGSVSHVIGGSGGLLRDPLELATTLLDMHEVTGEASLLDEASKLAAGIHEVFWKDDEGMVDRTEGAEDVGSLEKPRKELAENGTAAELYVRLADHLQEPDWRDRARRMLAGFPDYRGHYGHASATYALAVDRWLRPPTEVFMVRPTGTIRKAVIASRAPGRVIRHLDAAGAEARGFEPKPGVVVCHEGTCLKPARTVQSIEERLASVL